MGNGFHEDDERNQRDHGVMADAGYANETKMPALEDSMMKLLTVVAFSVGIGALLSSCAGAPVGRDGRTAGAAHSPVADAYGAGALYSPVELPPALRMRATDAGPVFTDDKGMTLYLWIAKHGACPADHDPIPENSSPLMAVYQASVPTCTAQWPPVPAPAAARPVGDWTILTRADGTRQWAYKEHPVHYSYKDRLPGDVNGGVADGYYGGFGGRAGVVEVAMPPLSLPPGIQVAKRGGVGLVATTAEGKALYLVDNPVHQHAKVAADDHSLIQKVSLRSESEAEPEKWRPLAAGAVAIAVGEWSAITESDGSKVWGYQGRPLYTYGGDHEQGDARGLLGTDSAHLIVLKPEAKAPQGVTVVRSLIGPVFADDKGMTLYKFNCKTPNPAGLDGTSGGAFACDNWNDDPSYSEQYCPGRDRCAEMWRPFRAPDEVQVRGGTWSVAVIPDPVHFPLRWVPLASEAARQEGAVKVWTYHGRPLYTATGETVSGGLWGHNYTILSGTSWDAALAGVSEEIR
jgi:predicted lipoprotein with Yx(FWY)xxD motif